MIGGVYWHPAMNAIAGTIQKIDVAIQGHYGMNGSDWTFSPEMISGPAEPPNEYTDMVKAIRKKTDEVIAAGPDACKKYLAELWGMDEPDREKYAERLKWRGRWN